MKKRKKICDFSNAFGQLVYVEWIDSQITYGWRNPETDDLPCQVKSVGILVAAIKTCITISTSISDGGRFLDKLTIPRECIKKLRRFSLK